MDKKTHILFTATFSNSFIRTDLSILQRHFHVTAIHSSGIGTFFRYLLHLPDSRITFSWFASVYSSALVLCAKLFGKRSVIILGGVDAAKIPEANYGIWNSRWKSAVVRYGITHADAVLAVDPSLKTDVMTLAQYDGANISILPTGHDHEYWAPGTGTRNNVVLTVATCDSETRFTIKGIGFLYSVAQAMPEQKFILVGMTDEIRKRHTPPSNIEIHPPLTQEQLLPLYQSSAVYFQPSMREALGSTLCEAMLCGCTPVGTATGGIPTVIEKTGYLISYGDTHEAIQAIRTALTQPRTEQGRRRIIDHFSLQQREAGLLRVLKELHG